MVSLVVQFYEAFEPHIRSNIHQENKLQLDSKLIDISLKNTLAIFQNHLFSPQSVVN